jgi:hypothetical protein
MLRRALSAARACSSSSSATNNRFSFQNSSSRRQSFLVSFSTTSSFSAANEDDDKNASSVDASLHFKTGGEIDTLALMRQLQKNNAFNEQQAEEVVKMFMKCMKAADFVTHAELQVEAQRNRHKFATYQMISDARIERANVKSETVERDLKQEAEKIRSELRYNFEKMNQTSRLDLNLEKGRMQDNLTLIDNKLLSTELRLDREIQSMRTQLEIKVNDIIRYGIGTLVSIGALGLGFLRFLT